MALTLRKTPDGWLAVSDTYPRIGVEGDTEEAAREKFEARRIYWENLKDLPMPAGQSEDG